MNRPFTFVNIAVSADGKISDEARRQVRISCEEDLIRVDKLRAFSDAIMVGIGTVLSDNPSLTIKNPLLRKERVKKGLTPNPTRVVIDSKLKTPPTSKVVDESAKTIIAVTESVDREKLNLYPKNVEIIFAGQSMVDLKKVVAELYSMGIRRLMVEGGGTLINSLLRDGLIDEINIYYGGMIIGGKNSPTPVDGNSFKKPIKLKLLNLQQLGDGIFARWKVETE